MSLSLIFPSRKCKGWASLYIADVVGLHKDPIPPTAVGGSFRSNLQKSRSKDSTASRGEWFRFIRSDALPPRSAFDL